MFMNSKVKATHQVSVIECKQQQQKITLKVFTSADIDDFMEWATDNEVTKYMMWNSYNSRSEAEVFFTNVVEKHSWFKSISLGEKVIGSITLDKGKGVHSCKAELGYVVARKYWGNGLATQAIKLAIQTGFKDLDIERIERIYTRRIVKKLCNSKRSFERPSYLFFYKTKFLKMEMKVNKIFPKKISKEMRFVSFLQQEV